MVDNDLLALTFTRRFIKLWIGVQCQLQHPFITATEHCQCAVRRDLGDRFMVIEVIAEFSTFQLFAFHHF